MGILGSIKDLFTVRYTNGSWWIGNQTAKSNNAQYMQLFKTIYPLNACIVIGATYASKFKWGVKLQDGTIDYEHDLLNLIKNPNPYQGTEDLIKQLFIYKSVHGWCYQKTFGAKGYEPSALYNLDPSNITFNNVKNTPLLVWKQKDISDNKNNTFIYDDNSNQKTFRFDEIIPFYDITNGVGNDLECMYTSPSRITAILDVLTNIELCSKAENITWQTAGREAMYATGEKQSSPDAFIHGVKSIGEKERKDVDNKLNNKGYLLNKRLRTFTPDTPIQHQDLSLKYKDFGIDEALSKNEAIIARHFGVPLELYQAYKNGATFENQQTALVGFLDNIKESFINDVASSWTMQFGNEQTPFVGTISHLRAIQEEDEKKYDKALKLSQTLANLQRAGIVDEQALSVLSDFGIDLNE